MAAFLIIAGLICLGLLAWAHQNEGISSDGMIGIWIACFSSAMILFAMAANIINKG